MERHLLRYRAAGARQLPVVLGVAPLLMIVDWLVKRSAQPGCVEHVNCLWHAGERPFALLAVVGLVLVWGVVHLDRRLLSLAAAAVLGGGAANLRELAVHGAVLDPWRIDLPGGQAALFANAADAFQAVGVLLLAVSVIVARRSSRRAAAAG